LFDKLWKIRRDGGFIAYFKKRKIWGGGGVLSEIPEGWGGQKPRKIQRRGGVNG